MNSVSSACVVVSLMGQSYGAAGVTISLGLVGAERAKELVEFTTALEMEAVLQVSHEYVLREY